VAFGEETFKRALKAKLVEALREELTSGDGNIKRLLTELLLSAVLRDSTGAELSGYLKNLDLLTGLLASDYDIISLDLSVARTDVLVASNVIFLKILESTTSTAQYTLKLFDTAKKAITRDIAPPGTTIERLRRASVYVSNPAQPAGYKLDLFVFMG